MGGDKNDKVTKTNFDPFDTDNPNLIIERLSENEIKVIGIGAPGKKIPPSEDYLIWWTAEFNLESLKMKLGDEIEKIRPASSLRTRDSYEDPTTVLYLTAGSYKDARSFSIPHALFNEKRIGQIILAQAMFGIVLQKSDLGCLHGLGGFVTDFNLKEIILQERV